MTVVSTTKDVASEIIFLDRANLYTTLQAVNDGCCQQYSGELILASDLSVDSKQGKPLATSTVSDNLSKLAKHGYLIRTATDDPTGEKSFTYGYMVNTEENQKWINEFASERTRLIKKGHDAERSRKRKLATPASPALSDRVTTLESIVNILCKDLGLSEKLGQLKLKV